MNADVDVSVYDLIAGTFLVAFSEEEMAQLDELYGVTTGLAEETTTTL